MQRRHPIPRGCLTCESVTTGNVLRLWSFGRVEVCMRVILTTLRQQEEREKCEDAHTTANLGIKSKSLDVLGIACHSRHEPSLHISQGL